MKAVLTVALCASILSAYALQRPPATPAATGIHMTSKDKDDSPDFIEDHPKPPQPPKPPKPPKPPHSPTPRPYPSPNDTPSPTPSATPMTPSTSAADNWRDY